MIILVINTGSSSLKFTCLDMSADTPLCSGMVERIAQPGTRLVYSDARKQKEKMPIKAENHSQAVARILERMTDPQGGAISGPDDISAVGHRLVHAGDKVGETVLIDERIKKIMEDCFHLAPLHNPPNLEGVRACEEYFPHAPQVGVFDTAFHNTIPLRAFLYGLPRKLYEEHGLRRYGFHGTSHKFIARRAAELLGKPLESLKIVSCHLGNGSSIAAVDGGKSIDTSMGMTPLEGLIMGTRCGDLDPGIMLFLLEQKGLSPAELNQLLNKQSGMLGLAEVGSPDLRDIEEAAQKGDSKASQALEAFAYRVRKYIGAYAAAMGGLDALLFSAGIGENSSLVRELACQRLEFLGVELDPELNLNLNRKEGVISRPGGKVAAMIIRTNEELEIALQTKHKLQSS